MGNESSFVEPFMHLAMLSLMSIGGGLVLIVPELKDYVVLDKQWLLDDQFTVAYAIAQAAPGPNLLFISLLGWLVFGWLGAIVATISVVLPPTLITLVFIKLRAYQVNSIFLQCLQSAFVPISVGLLSATGWMFANISNINWRADLLSLLTVILVLKTRINPVLLIAVGAIVGVFSFV